MIKTAVMGYGTIGSGVAEILSQNKAEVAKSAGQEVALKYVLDLRDFPDSPVADKIIHDFKIIEEDPEVQVVVETMGGLTKRKKRKISISKIFRYFSKMSVRGFEPRTT